MWSEVPLPCFFVTDFEIVSRDLRNISEMMLCLGIDKCCEYLEMRSCGQKRDILSPDSGALINGIINGVN